jgi:hypothetical protein
LSDSVGGEASLGALAPGAYDVQEIVDVHGAVEVDISFATGLPPACQHDEQIDDINFAAVVDVRKTLTLIRIEVAIDVITGASKYVGQVVDAISVAVGQVIPLHDVGVDLRPGLRALE